MCDGIASYPMGRERLFKKKRQLLLVADYCLRAATKARLLSTMRMSAVNCLRTFFHLHAIQNSHANKPPQERVHLALLAIIFTTG